MPVQTLPIELESCSDHLAGNKLITLSTAPNLALNDYHVFLHLKNHLGDLHGFEKVAFGVSDFIASESVAVAYPQRNVDTKVLEQMALNIKVAVRLGLQEISEDSMTPWMYCLAKSPNDGVSYRAVPEDCTHLDAGVVVRYLDYGNSARITHIPADVSSNYHSLACIVSSSFRVYGVYSR
ncbi:Tudor domain [Trinorchestia longiramus]|nr:Tudor domain [Trinorchestia longiramus]